ncbi:CD1871A family CXXC motif-containing protein [uncultured Eubacterium sp.]|nr:CD1871A family CXXC motif-containing protein [uncultured Eubacterium sp.]
MLKCKKICQLFVLIAGISMVSYGAIRGEAATVLGKAIKLCLECVGIG